MTGLILEGGGMRGLFTAGVLDTFMDHRLFFSGAIGVSAGAVFGCNFKTKQAGRVLRYNKRFCRDWRYCSLRSLLLTGDLFGAEFCYHTIPQKLDRFHYEAYAESSMPFYVVVTNVETGQAEYRLCPRADGEYIDVFRASASMPLVSRPVLLDGHKYLDGGMADSIPIRYFESIGYERNVVILTQPEGYVKQPSKAAKLMRRYPAMAETMAHRHEAYNAATAYVKQQELAGKALVIRPAEALDIGRIEHDPRRMQRVYDQGRAAAFVRMNELNRFLDWRRENIF